MTVPGLTVEDYAREKQLPVAFLHQIGVRTYEEDGKPPCVAIPYQDRGGCVVFTKYRGSGTPRFWSDRGAAPVLYGLDRLAEAEPNRPVILVEGESDAQTGWYHGLLVIGIPGATAWRRDWATHVLGRPGYVWQEPGEAAEKFVQKIARDLDGLLLIRPPVGVKDVSELHLDDPDGFRDRLAALLEAAEPAPEPEPTLLRHRRMPLPRPSQSRSPVTDRQIERARRIPITHIANRLRLEFGRLRHWAICPFHDDNDPSLHVNEKKGRAFCNVCDDSWDGIGLWMRVRSVDFPTAVRELTR